MRIDLWTTRLAEFKRHEKPETVLILSGSAELTRIAAAWSGMSVVRKRKLSPYVQADEDATWRWLWENTDYSMEELLLRLPVSPEKTKRNFAALVANHVLYPDGTVNSFVQRFLHEKVLNLFRVQRPVRGRERSAS